MKKCETNRLFWNEYPYKLVIRNILSPIFRNKDLSNVRQILDILQADYVKGLPLTLARGSRKYSVTEEHFVDAKRLLNFFSKKDDYRIRVEFTGLTVYSSDHIWIKQIIKSLNPSSVKEFWEPTSDITKHLDKNVIILSEDLGFDFRITLGNRKGNSGFATFAKTNPHLVRVGPVLMRELENDGYVSGMYFYARDEKTIQLCQLMLGNIRRIDKIIYKQDIDK